MVNGAMIRRSSPQNSVADRYSRQSWRLEDCRPGVAEEMHLWMRFMRHLLTKTLAALAVITGAGLTLGAPAALAGPSARVAKRCFRYQYIVYPYQRPGSVRMSGDRQAYFRNCMAKNGNVPVPTAPKSPKS